MLTDTNRPNRGSLLLGPKIYQAKANTSKHCNIINTERKILEVVKHNNLCQKLTVNKYHENKM